MFGQSLQWWNRNEVSKERKKGENFCILPSHLLDLASFFAIGFLSNWLSVGYIKLVQQNFAMIRYAN